MAKIKICGLFRNEDIEFVNLAKPDYVGFVFAGKSRRFVAPEFAAELSKKLNPDIVSVGVFVGADMDDIVGLFDKGVIRAAQLHGGESDEYIAELKKRREDLTVVRAISADNIPNGAREKAAFGADYVSYGMQVKEAFGADYVLDGAREKAALGADNISENGL
jgi:phosphoribosylanthranilate isomerase